MNYCVPDFEMEDEDYVTPASPTLTRPDKLALGDQGELMEMELLWENGQPVLQSQTQRSFTKRPLIQDDDVAPSGRRASRSSPPIQPGLNDDDRLFMQEDEMAFWLHHYPPLDCTDLYSGVIDPASPRAAPPLSAAASQPGRSDAENPEAVRHFAHISSRAKARAVVEQGPSRTEGESCETPFAAAAESVASRVAGSTVEVPGGVAGLCAAAGGRGGENGTCELMSSSGGSGSLEPMTEGDGKRKRPEADDYSEGPNEDVECESPDARKQVRGSPAKKSRIAEVHNLSERRRRDRINKKMRALQELIPGCNKSDKASMLDEAIEYLKSLQQQVQMMSMGCSMVPMMFPGIRQYMPPMGMATGMGMGMEMDMSQPMLPFPSVLAGSALSSPGAAAYMRPSFPVPVFHMPSFPLPNPSNQSDRVLKSLGPQNQGQPQMMNFPGPYQRYPGLRHTTATAPESRNHAARYQ